MSKEIKIYLAFIDDTDQYQFKSFRSLEEFEFVWEELSARCISILIHVGFAMINSDSVEQLLRDNEKEVLITASAKWTLPLDNFSSEEQSRDLFSDILNESIHTYKIRPDKYIKPSHHTNVTNSKYNDIKLPEIGLNKWIKILKDNYFSLYNEISSLGISTDNEYLSNRHSLSANRRTIIDNIRYSILIKEIDDTKPFQILSIAPQWLFEVPISMIQTTVRLKNLFETHKINTIADLLEYRMEQVLEWRNCGRKSMLDMADSLKKTLKRNPSVFSKKEQNIETMLPYSVEKEQDKKKLFMKLC